MLGVITTLEQQVVTLFISDEPSRVAMAHVVCACLLLAKRKLTDATLPVQNSSAPSGP
jgi:hypothetical protein